MGGVGPVATFVPVKVVGNDIESLGEAKLKTVPTRADKSDVDSADLMVVVQIQSSRQGLEKVVGILEIGVIHC